MAHINKVYMVTWFDAAWCDTKTIPKNLPKPQIAFGLISQNNPDYIFVVSNGNWNKETESFNPIDGMLLPRGVVKEIKEIGVFTE